MVYHVVRERRDIIMPRMPRVLSSSFARSLFFVVGGSIGAGMFGLPALFSGSGLIWGSLAYWVIVAVALIIHVAYADLQAKVGSKHDLAGIAKQSLGRFGWLVAIVTYPINVYGVLLVYLLLGSQFVAALSGAIGGPTSLFFWQVVLWAFFAWGAHKGVKGVAKFERPITIVVVSALVLASCLAALSGNTPSISLFPGTFSFSTFIGVVFFASLSLPVVVEVMALDARRGAIGRRAVIIGTLIAATLKWFFALSFAGAAQGQVIEVVGLMRALPVALSWLLPLAGFVAISGAAVSCLDSLQTTYRDEFAFPRWSAWILAILPPLVLIFVSQQSLLPLMTFLGSFVASTNALLVCLAALVMRTRLMTRPSRFMMYAAIGLCLFSIVHTFIL